MTKEKKFVHLSQKNAEKVFDWAEIHQDTDVVADEYMAICYALGNFSITQILENHPSISFINLMEVKEYLYKSRDSYGREILKIIKAGEGKKHREFLQSEEKMNG